MHICIDIDDTITYCPELFAKLCAAFEGARISIVTFRTDRESTVEYLDTISIRYDELIMSSDATHGKTEQQTLAQWKAGFVNSIQPDLFFEDMPEVVALIDPGIHVFMPCDDVIRSWIREKLGNSSGIA